MISNAQDDVCSDDQSEEDMSEMEVIIRTIQNEVTGLKVSDFFTKSFYSGGCAKGMQ